jgi:hypothetical protein
MLAEPYPQMATPVVAKTDKPEKEERVVRIFRGDKVTEIRFE